MRNKFLIFLLFLGVTTIAMALDSDNDKPLYLQADSVSIDNETGKSFYKGNVTLQQGTTHLTADWASVLVDKNHAIEEAMAKSTSKTQVHYQTITDINKPELNAYADMMHFYPQKHEVHLIGHAKVIQGTDSYAAPEIVYNSETKQVISPKTKTGRTTIIIHPTAKK